jgi:hypothetical protein
MKPKLRQAFHVFLLVITLGASSAQLVSIPGSANAQDVQQTILGNWEGLLTVSTVKLRLVLKVSKNAEGNLTAVMDSIDQPNANISDLRLQISD